VSWPQWNKKVGDKVKSGDILAEIETDKATMEFESYLGWYAPAHRCGTKARRLPVDSVLAVLREGRGGHQQVAGRVGGGAPKAESSEGRAEGEVKSRCRKQEAAKSAAQRLLRSSQAAQLLQSPRLLRGPRTVV
jgi:pyruvate dehydrogenase E2 component (dihydrolipoamide acetyltransferase)